MKSVESKKPTAKERCSMLHIIAGRNLSPDTHLKLSQTFMKHKEDWEMAEEEAKNLRMFLETHKTEEEVLQALKEMEK